MDENGDTQGSCCGRSSGSMDQVGFRGDRWSRLILGVNCLLHDSQPFGPKSLFLQVLSHRSSNVRSSGVVVPPDVPKSSRKYTKYHYTVLVLYPVLPRSFKPQSTTANEWTIETGTGCIPFLFRRS